MSDQNIVGPTEAEVTARVDALLGKLSLVDKIGQLNQAGGLALVPGPKPEDVLRKGRRAPQGRGGLRVVGERPQALQ